MIEKYLQIIRGKKCVEKYELLAFHTMGFFKYENLGIDNLHTTKFDAFNEGVSIIGHSRFFYKLKQ